MSKLIEGNLFAYSAEHLYQIEPVVKKDFKGGTTFYFIEKGDRLIVYCEGGKELFNGIVDWDSQGFKFSWYLKGVSMETWEEWCESGYEVRLIKEEEK